MNDPNSEFPIPATPSRYNRNVVCAALLGLVVGIGVVGGLFTLRSLKNNQAREAEGRRSFEGTIGTIEQELSQKIATGEGTKQGDESALGKMRRDLESSAKATPNTHAAKVARAFSQIFARAEKAGAALAKETRNAADAGVFEIATVTNLEELTKRRVVCLAVITESAKLIQVYDDYEQVAREEFRRAGLSEEEFKESFERARSLIDRRNTLSKKLRETDIRLAAATFAIFTLMEATWGRWEYQNKNLTFEDEQAVSTFRKLAADRDAAATEQSIARRELAESFK